MGKEVVELEVSGFKTNETTVIAANLGFQYLKRPYQHLLLPTVKNGKREYMVEVDYPYILQVSILNDHSILCTSVKSEVTRLMLIGVHPRSDVNNTSLNRLGNFNSIPLFLNPLMDSMAFFQFSLFQRVPLNHFI